MPKKQRKFADDGWAVWIDGDDTSTVYLNDWIDPKGKSYVDLAIRIRRVKASTGLHVYVPFVVTDDEIEDVSLLFRDTKILQATFSAACIVDYKKNEHTSEIAYNGKTVDIVHFSTLQYKTVVLSEGTLINIDLETLRPFLDNDEAYFIWRMPHKSLDEIFRAYVDVKNVMGMVLRMVNLHQCVRAVGAVGLCKRVRDSLQWKVLVRNVMDWDAKLIKNAANVMAVVFKINNVHWK